jgi:hypothetical protein
MGHMADAASAEMSSRTVVGVGFRPCSSGPKSSG